MTVTHRSQQRRRLKAQPCYVLHSYDYSESSLILEVWSQDWGRIAVIAKGARKPLSGFRAVLLPLQPLLLDLSLPEHKAVGGDDADDSMLASLKGAQWGGGMPMMAGDALLAGLYMNELLLRLLPREDPMPALYALYHACIQIMARAALERAPVQAWVRLFELGILAAAGYLPDLQNPAAPHSLRTQTDNGLMSDAFYQLRSEVGLVRIDSSSPIAGSQQGLLGQQWSALGVWVSNWQRHAVMADTSALQTTLNSRQLREQLRHAIEHIPLWQSTAHATKAFTLENRPVLRTRQFMREVQALLAS